MSNLRIYNTLYRKKDPFEPLNPPKVGLYTCGPTVYNYVHIGNLRTYIFEDILKRVLKYNGYQVNHVMNITDVGHLTDDADQGEDKMEKGARREGKTAWEIAEFYTQSFKKDLQDLNILEPTTWCKATDNIPEQIALIEQLEKNGFTYRTEDGVYFDTSKLADYGKLAGIKKATLKPGARVELGDKKNPTDFALWKFSPTDKQRQMEWESQWGRGFPGWHIECSAMAAKYLGVPFDIHCGGIDHIPVHHTNEIAQTEGASGKILANYWLHGEFLLINKDRMAKSGENFITLETVKQRGFSPLAYRYFVLQTHYRQQLNFSWEALQAAQNGLRNLYIQAWHHKKTFLKATTQKQIQNEEDAKKILDAVLNDDLGTPQFLAAIQEDMKKLRISYETLNNLDKNILGLDIEKGVEDYNEFWKKTLNEIKFEELPEEVKKLLQRREQAKKQKDYKTSDEIRNKVEEQGFKIKDNPDGTQIITKK